jgi:hypothetical protein
LHTVEISLGQTGNQRIEIGIGFPQQLQAVRVVEGQVKARGGRRINGRADDPPERPQRDRAVPERAILQIQQAACPSACLPLLQECAQSSPMAGCATSSPKGAAFTGRAAIAPLQSCSSSSSDPRAVGPSGCHDLTKHKCHRAPTSVQTWPISLLSMFQGIFSSIPRSPMQFQLCPSYEIIGKKLDSAWSVDITRVPWEPRTFNIRAVRQVFPPHCPILIQTANPI